MPATPDELAYARSWIGDAETDGVFNSRVDRLLPGYESQAAAIDAAIEEAMRHRLAVLTMDQPTSMSISGISVSFGEGMRLLRENLKSFVSVRGSGVYGVTSLVRPDIR